MTPAKPKALLAIVGHDKEIQKAISALHIQTRARGTRFGDLARHHQDVVVAGDADEHHQTNLAVDVHLQSTK